MTMCKPSHPGASVRHCLENSDLTANGPGAGIAHQPKQTVSRAARRPEHYGGIGLAAYDLAQARRKLEAP